MLSGFYQGTKQHGRQDFEHILGMLDDDMSVDAFLGGHAGWDVGEADGVGSLAEHDDGCRLAQTLVLGRFTGFSGVEFLDHESRAGLVVDLYFGVLVNDGRV